MKLIGRILYSVALGLAIASTVSSAVDGNVPAAIAWGCSSVWNIVCYVLDCDRDRVLGWFREEHEAVIKLKNANDSMRQCCEDLIDVNKKLREAINNAENDAD